MLKNNLGEAYEALGRHDEAVEAFRQCDPFEAGLWKAYFNLGKTMLTQGNREGAIEQYVLLQNLDQDWLKNSTD